MKTCARVAACLWLVMIGRCQGAENSLLADLLKAGVESTAGAAIPLPAPLLADGLSAAAQRSALEKIVDAAHPLDGLLRKSVVAPFVLEVVNVPNTPSLRRVDLYFVVHAKLEKLSDDTFLRQQFAAETKGDTSATAPSLVELTNEELASRRLTTIAPEERFFAGNFTLFDRVRLGGVVHAHRSTNPESVTVAMRFDPRFDSDPQHPNAWQALRRDEAGKQQPGAPQRYHAAAGYLKATRLVEPAGALFVEYHILFDEPTGWFDGANLLRSKLPLVCQDSIRKLRRRVGEESQK